MKKWFTIIFSGAVMVVFIAGCSKGGAATDNGNGTGNGPHIINPADTTPPVVEIYTPTPNQVYTTGSIINITGKVTDGDGLYQGSIRITNDATGALLKEQLYEIHGILQYNFNISYTSSVTVASDYTITVWYEDHGQNVTTKTVKVKINL